MQLRIVTLREDFVEIEVENEDPSILDSLAEILQRMDEVEYAGVVVEHPLTMKSILRVKTDKQKMLAKDALTKALSELSKLAEEFEEKIKEL